MSEKNQIPEWNGGDVAHVGGVALQECRLAGRKAPRRAGTGAGSAE